MTATVPLVNKVLEHKRNMKKLKTIYSHIRKEIKSGQYVWGYGLGGRWGLFL